MRYAEDNTNFTKAYGFQCDFGIEQKSLLTIACGQAFLLWNDYWVRLGLITSLPQNQTPTESHHLHLPQMVRRVRRFHSRRRQSRWL